MYNNEFEMNELYNRFPSFVDDARSELQQRKGKAENSDSMVDIYTAFYETDDETDRAKQKRKVVESLRERGQLKVSTREKGEGSKPTSSI